MCRAWAGCGAGIRVFVEQGSFVLESGGATGTPEKGRGLEGDLRGDAQGFSDPALQAQGVHNEEYGWGSAMVPEQGSEAQLEGFRGLSVPLGSSGVARRGLGSLELFSPRSNMVRFYIFCF